MVDQISIEGTPTEFESLSVSLPAGTGGPTASLSFVAGLHLIPAKGDKIEFSIGGLTWTNGICDSNPATYEGKTKVVSVSVLGVQHMLDRKVTYDGGPASLSEILTELFTGSGVAAGILGTEPADPIFFPFEGKLLDAVEQLQTRTGGFLAWIAPDGDFYLINPDDGHTAHELPWTGGTGYTLGQLQDLSGLQKTRFRVTGRNPKVNLGDPDFLDYSQVYGGDGISTKFEYDPRVTEVVAVYVDATQQTFVPEGSAQQGVVDCYNSIEQSAVIFNTAPADGTAITIEGVIDQATAEVNDTAEQTALAASFGGDGVRLVEESHPELVSQADCDAYAEGMKLRYGKKMRELTAEVWKDVAIYLPSNKVTANDGLGFSATLPVQNCTAAREGGKWIQQVTIGDGPPGGQTTPGQGFKRIAQRLKKASLPPQPPAPTQTTIYYTEDLDFSLAVTPADRTVDAGTTDPITFTVEATALGGFAGPITLAATVPTGVLKSFSPAVITPGTPSTLTLTPPEGGWTEAMAGNVTVSGTSTPLSHNADPVDIVVDPPCTGDYTIIIGNDNPTCPSCQTHYIQFKAISENPGCVGQTVSIQIQSLSGIGPSHPCYPNMSDWWTVSDAEFDLTIAADAESATPVEIEFYPNGEEEEGCGPNNRKWCGPDFPCYSQTTYAAFTATGPDEIPQVGCFMVSDQGGC